MSIKGFDKSKLRTISDITPEQHDLMCAFLQGAVYCWCKNHPDDWFAFRDLLNFYWQGTPLYALWLKQEKRYGITDDSTPEQVKQALTAAAIDAGWLLKEVLANDKREFDQRKAFKATQYLWVGGDEEHVPQEDAEPAE